MEPQKPTRVQGDGIDDYSETHPAYAVIGAARVSHGGAGGGAILFGSDFRHNGYVVIRIAEATLYRGLAYDRVHGGREYLEVALSEAQWATFVSTLNYGEGVPCTVTRTAEAGYLPTIELDGDRREQFNVEIDERLQIAVEAIRAIRDAAPTKKLRAEAERALMQLTSNLAFVARSFDEHAEKTVEKAKIEVSAYVTGAMQRAGLQAIATQVPIEMLALPEVVENGVPHGVAGVAGSEADG